MEQTQKSDSKSVLQTKMLQEYMQYCEKGWVPEPSACPHCCWRKPLPFQLTKVGRNLTWVCERCGFQQDAFYGTVIFNLPFDFSEMHKIAQNFALNVDVSELGGLVHTNQMVLQKAYRALAEKYQDCMLWAPVSGQADIYVFSLDYQRSRDNAVIMLDACLIVICSDEPNSLRTIVSSYSDKQDMVDIIHDYVKVGSVLTFHRIEGEGETAQQRQAILDEAMEQVKKANELTIKETQESVFQSCAAVDLGRKLQTEVKEYFKINPHTSPSTLQALVSRLTAVYAFVGREDQLVDLLMRYDSVQDESGDESSSDEERPQGPSPREATRIARHIVTKRANAPENSKETSQKKPAPAENTTAIRSDGTNICLEYMGETFTCPVNSRAKLIPSQIRALSVAMNMRDVTREQIIGHFGISNHTYYRYGLIFKTSETNTNAKIHISKWTQQTEALLKLILARGDKSTYEQIADEISRTYPSNPVTKGAVAVKMSELGIRRKINNLSSAQKGAEGSNSE